MNQKHTVLSLAQLVGSMQNCLARSGSWFSCCSVAFLPKCGVVGVKGVAGTDVWSVIAKVSQVTPYTISSKGNKETIEGANNLGKMNDGGVLGLCQLSIIGFA
jgi:hypothetical protein